MADYKDILLLRLAEAGWAQDEVIPTGHWRRDEIWRVKSITTNWGFTLYLSFVYFIHPGVPLKVSDVELSTDDPDDGGSLSLASLPIKMKDLIAELPEFLETMNRLREGQAVV